MVKVTVTAPPPAPEPKIPIAGEYQAVLRTIHEPTDNSGWGTIWEFEDSQKTWQYRYDVEDLGVLLAVLGKDPGEVDTEDLPGTKATVDVRTFGGRTSAQIVEVKAPEADG